ERERVGAEADGLAKVEGGLREGAGDGHRGPEGQAQVKGGVAGGVDDAQRPGEAHRRAAEGVATAGDGDRGEGGGDGVVDAGGLERPPRGRPGRRPWPGRRRRPSWRGWSTGCWRRRRPRRESPGRCVLRGLPAAGETSSAACPALDATSREA